MGEVRTKTVFLAEDDSEHATFEAATAQNEFMESIREANSLLIHAKKSVGDAIAESGCYPISDEQYKILTGLKVGEEVGGARVFVKWFESNGIYCGSNATYFRFAGWHYDVETLCKIVTTAKV